MYHSDILLPLSTNVLFVSRFANASYKCPKCKGKCKRKKCDNKDSPFVVEAGEAGLALQFLAVFLAVRPFSFRGLSADASRSLGFQAHLDLVHR